MRLKIYINSGNRALWITHITVVTPVDKLRQIVGKVADNYVFNPKKTTSHELSHKKQVYVLISKTPLISIQDGNRYIEAVFCNDLEQVL